MAAFAERTAEESPSDEARRMVAEAERTAARWQSISSSVRAIAGALEDDEILTRLRQAVLPELGDLCLIDRVGERGLERVLIEAVDPLIAERARQIARTAPTPVAAHPIAVALDNARLFAEVRNRVRERDEHLTMVAHDLQNPLLAVRMEAERLGREGDQLPESAARIGRQVRAMREMVIELLDFASFTDGRARLSLEPVDPIALVNEAFDTLAPIADAEGVALELRARESLPGVLCDRARIWQVLSNLLANAIRHGQAGRVVVTLASQAGELCFSIADQGSGIGDQELARLFEPGHSAVGSTGLGLAICRRIVEAHAGWIWAESVAGQGATFHFTLPMAAID